MKCLRYLSELNLCFLAYFVRSLNLQMDGKIGEYDSLSHQNAFASHSLDFKRFTIYDHICFVANFLFFLSSSDQLILQNAVESLRNWMEFCSKERVNERRASEEEAAKLEREKSDRAKANAQQKTKKKSGHSSKISSQKIEKSNAVDLSSLSPPPLSLVPSSRLFKLQNTFLLSFLKRTLRSPRTDRHGSWLEERRGHIETLSSYFLCNFTSESCEGWGPAVAGEGSGVLPLLLDIQVFQKLKGLRKLKRIFGRCFGAEKESAALLSVHRMEEREEGAEEEEEEEGGRAGQQQEEQQQPHSHPHSASPPH